MEKVLMRLCATYLAVIKRGGYAYDPVAHFHLKNGAVMWRINWLADLSPKGLSQSCGIMVNYRYFIEECDTNSQQYVADQHINTSESVQNLLK
ncbi:unnamed protein product [Allacma fusca]|uniref:Malonyl-CoA decarboxylase C-terminal domain-containing protein n=1 Tax=Allacma fusca TaxID=39272 RepID=A0A8J2KYQ0_9HEXA|nr:unnamed protein product [Allacma fusca]